MKRLFRERKTSLRSSSKPAPSSQTPPSPIKDTEAPLYARFATVHRRPSQDGPPKPVVSAPMQLSSRASRSSMSRSVKSGRTGGEPQDRHSKLLKKMPSKQEQFEPKVLASPPTHSSSRLPPSVPNLSGIAVESHKLDISAVLHPERSPVSPDQREERHADEGRRRSVLASNSPQVAENRTTRTESSETSSITSSRSSSAPPSPQRRLVVRNADPEVSNDASPSLSDIVGVINGFTSSPHPHTPISMPSPPAYHGSLDSTGFALPTDARETTIRGFKKEEGASLSTLPSPPTPTSFSPSFPYTHANLSSGTHASSSGKEQPVPVSAPMAIPYKSSSPSSAPVQPSPSTNRKQHSPTAAFGLSQSSTTSVPTMATNGTRTKQVPASDTGTRTPLAKGTSTSHTLEKLPPPVMTSPLPVMTSPPPGNLSSYSRPSHRTSVVYDPAPVAAPDSSRENGTKRREGRQEVPVEQYGDFDRYPKTRRTEPVAQVSAKKSQSHRQRAPPDGVHESSNGSFPHSAPVSDRTVRNPSNPSHPREPIVPIGHSSAPGYPQLQQSAHPTPSRQNSTASMMNQSGRAAGRPLIFQAMETTSEIHDIEPGIVGMIGSASVQAKTEEGYQAYAYSGAHVSKPLPEPKPEQIDTLSPRRKSSKLHKAPSQSKMDPVRMLMHAMEKHHADAIPSVETRPEMDASHRSGPFHRQHSSSAGPQPDPRRLSREVGSRMNYNSGAPDPGRHDRDLTSRDSMLERRGRDGMRHMTEKQREMLQHRTSYVDPGQPRPYQVDPRSKPLVHQSSQQVAENMSRLAQPLPAPPPAQGFVEQASRSFVPMPEARRFEMPVPPGQLPLPQPYYMQPQSPSGGVPRSRVPDVPQYGHVASERPQSMHQHELPPIPTSVEAPQFVPPAYDPSPVQLAPPREEDLVVQTRRGTKKRREKVKSFLSDGLDLLREKKSTRISAIPTFYPLVSHLSEPTLLEHLLVYLSFYEWTNLWAVSKQIRYILFVQGREQVLERYLRTVGYAKWIWKNPEPLVLSVEDLCHYMRGVSIPSYKYATTARNYLQSQSSVDSRTMHDLVASCRAFTRVVLRLRCQAEAEAAHNARVALYEMPSTSSLHSQGLKKSPTYRTPPNGGYPAWQQSADNVSRSSSRAPSPSSSYSHLPMPSRANTLSSRHKNGSRSLNSFQSPLFRLRRAPLLQVFVPSPEGDWLSDTSVLECEAELNRASVMHLLRAGDVVWDVAAGDEGNVGRLVWDGNYLIDLDYTYSRVGDPPRYLPSLAFPPSYFHRIIRTMGAGNPIVRIDVSPWGEEIMANVRLLQDKIRMETPQGTYHNVVRWVNRSSFTIRAARGSQSIRLPMPPTAGVGPSPTGAWVVDPDWYGVIIVETEGTNEGREELQERCRVRVTDRTSPAPEAQDSKTIWRILRERSRPGEIWIRVVSRKERLVAA